MFRIGQRVVCVDDSDSIGIVSGGQWEEFPRRGQIYTVSAKGLVHPSDPLQLPCILVAELSREAFEPLWAHRFRPLIERKTDIGFAHEILRKVSRPKRVSALSRAKALI